MARVCSHIHVYEYTTFYITDDMHRVPEGYSVGTHVGLLIGENNNLHPSIHGFFRIGIPLLRKKKWRGPLQSNPKFSELLARFWVVIKTCCYWRLLFRI